MRIEPKVRGFICTTAHPVGCAQGVLAQINHVTSQAPIAAGPKKVLIIGAASGYGLASRIVAAFGAQAQTIGIFFGRAAESQRTACASWYNTVAFEQIADQAGLYAKSINGDAFAKETKQKTIELIQQDWGGSVDLVIYSIASPRRIHPTTGEVFRSVIKPIGQPYTNKTIDVIHKRLLDITIEPATTKEIADTVAVMGGEDWMLWIDALLEANVLAKGIQTVAYSYIGPELTAQIYANGTIGQAKKHLTQMSQVLNQRLQSINGKAFISINKALVTQSSAAIPVVPLYISLLYKIMKEKNIHEGCIAQMYRLFTNYLYTKDAKVSVDEQGLIRIDDWEMRSDVQEAVLERWTRCTQDNIDTLTDLAGYRHEFFQLFGFDIEGVDYSQPCVVNLDIPSLSRS